MKFFYRLKAYRCFTSLKNFSLVHLFVENVVYLAKFLLMFKELTFVH